MYVCLADTAVEMRDRFLINPGLVPVVVSFLQRYHRLRCLGFRMGTMGSFAPVILLVSLAGCSRSQSGNDRGREEANRLLLGI